MNWIGYSITVILSTFLGWFIIRIAVKMIFHPIRPVKILGFSMQGFFPGNQKMIAEKLAQAVSTEFISFKAVESEITDPENLQKLKPEIEAHIDDFLRHRLKDTFPMISMFIGDKTISKLKNAFLMELEDLFPILMKKYMATMQEKLDLEKIITERVANFPSEKLEDILLKTTKKEFIFLELFCALYGFLIGLIQVLVIHWTN